MPPAPKITEKSAALFSVAARLNGTPCTFVVMVAMRAPNAAPVTVKHIVKLFRMGCYDTNHVFRVASRAKTARTA